MVLAARVDVSYTACVTIMRYCLHCLAVMAEGLSSGAGMQYNYYTVSTVVAYLKYAV
jgi:hypothetical protein